MIPWPYNDRPADLALPDFGLSPEDAQELTEEIWSSLVTGRDDAEDFADIVQDTWPLTEQQLRQAFDLARQARLRQQEQWSTQEVSTNLDRAFAELNEAGILARQNFTCCGTCGAAEIGGERDESRSWRGYLFFHQQDTESLIGTGEVYLSYGVFAPEDFDEEAYERLSDEQKSAQYEADLQRVIGQEAVPRLESHGLRVEWDGDHRKRILVRDAQWFIRL